MSECGQIRAWSQGEQSIYRFRFRIGRITRFYNQPKIDWHFEKKKKNSPNEVESPNPIASRIKHIRSALKCGATRCNLACQGRCPYTLPTIKYFNENLQLQSAREAADLLGEAGATVYVCHNIHSKIFCMDSSVFMEGSFNWLSAERGIGKYARHELSLVCVGDLAADLIEEAMQGIKERAIAIDGARPHDTNTNDKSVSVDANLRSDS